jgi:hypothetical protein
MTAPRAVSCARGRACAGRVTFVALGWFGTRSPPASSRPISSLPSAAASSGPGTFLPQGSRTFELSDHSAGAIRPCKVDKVDTSHARVTFPPRTPPHGRKEDGSREEREDAKGAFAGLEGQSIQSRRRTTNPDCALRCTDGLRVLRVLRVNQIGQGATPRHPSVGRRLNRRHREPEPGPLACDQLWSSTSAPGAFFLIESMAFWALDLEP